MQDRRTLIRVAVVSSCLLWPGINLLAQSSAAAGATTTSSVSAAKKTAKPAASASSRNKSTAKIAPLKKATANSSPHSVAGVHRKAATTTAASKAKSSRPSIRRRTHYKPPTARSIKLTKAFLASEQLRPMAQQLAAASSPAAYAGVLHYAQSHPGEGAAAAYLALGHAYMQDHRYADAIGNFNQAKALRRGTRRLCGLSCRAGRHPVGPRRRFLHSARPLRRSLSRQHLRHHRARTSGRRAPAAERCARRFTGTHTARQFSSIATSKFPLHHGARLSTGG